jgi:dolichol-phosphate mannosyltransferase
MYTVVVPILNEVDNIQELVNRLGKDPSEILFCDNGSSDGSVPLIEGLSRGDPRVKLSLGRGTVTQAVSRGIFQAIHPRVIVMDGDLSHPPELVPVIADLLLQYDIVLGSRYGSGGCSKDTFVNKILSRGLTLLTFPLAPGIKDRSTGFFGVRKNLVLNPLSSACKPALEILVRDPIVSFKEVTYSFQKRTHGKSKIGRGYATVGTAKDLVLLYISKYRKIVKAAMVGAFGTSIYLGLLALFTEVFHIWYFASAIMGAGISFCINFTLNNYWTFSARPLKAADPDYEYYAWYKGNFVQRVWKRRIAKETLEEVPRSGRVLDVGCGSSPLLGMLPGRVTGIDRNAGKLEVQRKRCPESVELILCDLSDGSKPSLSNSFDSVVCNNVLEHLDNPKSTLNWISGCLKDQGKLVVTVPDSGNRFTPIIEGLYGRIMPKAYASEHCYEFTPKELDTLCMSASLVFLKRKRVFTDMVCVYQKRGP